MAHYTKDKQSLQHTKARLTLLTKNNDALTWEHEVLEQRFDQVCINGRVVKKKYHPNITQLVESEINA